MKKNIIIALLVSLILLSGCSEKINNNSDNKYCDQAFNDYIEECSILIERNDVEI